LQEWILRKKLFDDDDEDTSNNDSSDEDEETDDIDVNEIADVLQKQTIADDNNVDDEEEEADDNNVDEEEEETDGNVEEEEEQTVDNVYETDNNNDVEEVADEQLQQPALRRSNRVSKSSQDSIYSYLQARDENTEEYSGENVPVIAMIKCHINEKMAAMSGEEAYGFIQTYSLKAGLKKFGEKGSDAATKEMKQLHDRKVFKPIMTSELTTQERKRAMESLIFLTEKRDGRVKVRTCAKCSIQRDYIPREDAASPTASTESFLITGVIEAKQRREIMTLDIPNAFVQTPIP
jgi:hypothetical protein